MIKDIVLNAVDALGRRGIMILAVAVVAIPLFYMYVWNPINDERRRLRMSLSKMRPAVAVMKNQAVEVARLKATLAASGSEAARAQVDVKALNASAKSFEITDLHVLKAPLKVARVSIPSVSFEKYLQWIAYLQKNEEIRVRSSRLRVTPAGKNIMVETEFVQSTR